MTSSCCRGLNLRNVFYIIIWKQNYYYQPNIIYSPIPPCRSNDRTYSLRHHTQQNKIDDDAETSSIFFHVTRAIRRYDGHLQKKKKLTKKWVPDAKAEVVQIRERKREWLWVVLWWEIVRRNPDHIVKRLEWECCTITRRRRYVSRRFFSFSSIFFL